MATQEYVCTGTKEHVAVAVTCSTLSTCCCKWCYDLHSGADQTWCSNTGLEGKVWSWAPVVDSRAGNRSGGCVRWWKAQEAQDSGFCLSEKDSCMWVGSSKAADEEQGHCFPGDYLVPVCCLISPDSTAVATAAADTQENQSA